MPEGEVDVNLGHVAGMRGDRQAPGMGCIRHLNVFGDAPRRVTSGWT